MKKLLLIFFLLAFYGNPLISQGFIDHQGTEQLLKQLNREYSNLTRLTTIAKTPGDRDIRVLTIGKGDMDNHPGLAVVSGVDGRYISGPALVTKFAESLLKESSTDSISNLLDSITFYVIPNLSPDATEQYFRLLKYERNMNDRMTDEDRDGRIDEDPFEDLNGDSLITLVRIKDPTGNWIPHPDDDRIMVRADKKKGEKGAYIVITEGVDNDLDGRFNEDGAGGICFNQNMTFRFDHFKAGSGEFPVSEPECRGFLDFLYRQWNIYCVYTFGPSDNLSKPFPYIESDATANVICGMQEKDVLLNTLVSDRYNNLTGKKKHNELTLFNGGFLQWAYFHYGRQSFGTPGFYIPEIKINGDSTGSGDPEEEFNLEINFLKWADSIYTEPYFVNWETIEHPDFPGREAEVGGIIPYRMINPPEKMLDSLAEIHNGFIIWLASLRPGIRILNMESTDLGNHLYRLEMDVYNPGIFPAMSGIGEKTRWVKKPKVTLICSNEQEILGGKKIELLDQLDGDSGDHLSWLVRGRGQVSLEVGSPQTGFSTYTIDLR